MILMSTPNLNLLVAPLNESTHRAIAVIAFELASALVKLFGQSF